MSIHHTVFPQGDSYWNYRLKSIHFFFDLSSNIKDGFKAFFIGELRLGSRNDLQNVAKSFIELNCIKTFPIAISPSD
jgi:hypothetical protein